MKYAYEDFDIGSAVQLSAHTFTREEIVGFAERYDPQPFHLSEAAGEASHFGGLVASGWNTCSAMMGILVRDMVGDSTSMGSPASITFGGSSPCASVRPRASSDNRRCSCTAAWA